MRSSHALPHGALADFLAGSTRPAPDAHTSAASSNAQPLPLPGATPLRSLALLVGYALIVAACLAVDTISQLSKTTVSLAGYQLDARPVVGGALLALIAVTSVRAFAHAGLRRWLIEALLVIVGAVLLAVSANIKVFLPSTPVPFTLQTFAVLLIGAAYGWRRGLAAVAIYLAAGTVDSQVFAAVTGATTYGYLAGFAVGALVVGWLAERGWDRNLLTSILAMLLGEVAIFGCGLLWLAQFFGWQNAITFGLTPFLLGDAIKLVAAAIALPLAWLFVRGVRRFAH